MLAGHCTQELILMGTVLAGTFVLKLISCQMWQLGRTHIIIKLSQQHSRLKPITAISSARSFKNNISRLTLLVSLNTAFCTECVKKEKCVILVSITTEMSKHRVLHEDLCLNMFCQYSEVGNKQFQEFLNLSRSNPLLFIQ